MIPFWIIAVRVNSSPCLPKPVPKEVSLTHWRWRVCSLHLTYLLSLRLKPWGERLSELRKLPGTAFKMVWSVSLWRVAGKTTRLGPTGADELSRGKCHSHEPEYMDDYIRSYSLILLLSRRFWQSPVQTGRNLQIILWWDWKGSFPSCKRNSDVMTSNLPNWRRDWLQQRRNLTLVKLLHVIQDYWHPWGPMGECEC